MKGRKLRLDSLLVESGFFESREKAKIEIIAGNIYVNGQRVLKPSKLTSVDSRIEIKKRDPYVSRGAHKLKGAIDDLGLDVENKVACDIGASTGGFTQVLLELGAKKVFAVDVGKGQLHWDLRNDERVVVMEKVNARYLKKSNFPMEIQVLTCDVSFISVVKILPSIREILIENGEGLILIKPQFEAPREYLKKGLVKDPKVHIMVLERLRSKILEQGLSIVGLTFSKVKGQKGNIEFFYKIRKNSLTHSLIEKNDIEKIVLDAHRILMKEGEHRK